MKHPDRIIVAAAVLLVVFSAASLAQPPAEHTSQATSFRAAADFQLTADPLSPAWKGVPGISFQHGRYAEPIDGHLTELRSRWTEANLFLLFICDYENLQSKPGPPSKEETQELWNWDVAEVFIGSDFENVRRYKEFEVSPRGEWLDLAIEIDPGGKHIIDSAWNSGFASMARIDADAKVWYAEMRIPMSSIAPWKPAPGRTFRANFYRIQGSPQRLLAWQPVHQEWFHKPEVFGTLTLEGSTPHLP